MRWLAAAAFTAMLVGTSACAQDFETNVHTAPAPQNAARAEANAALTAGDFARALRLLTPLAAASPGDAPLQYDLGAAQDALDQTTNAERSYRAAIAAQSDLEEARVALGLLLARGGRSDEARTELLAAVKLTGADAALRARAYRALARLDRRSRPAEASGELAEALKLSPETADDTLLAAELAAVTPGEAGSAEAAYRRVLAAHPNDPAAVTSLAHLLLQQKRAADAEPLLTGAIQAHPDDAALRSQLAAVYAGEGKTEQAVPLLEALRAANPEDTAIGRALGELYLETGQDAKAEPLLAAALRASPADTQAADDRARALIHLKRHADAQALLAPLVAKPDAFPSPAARAEAAGDLAFAASENGDAAAALDALQVRAQTLPPTPALLFLTAISHDKLKHTQLAREAYKKFLAASNGAFPNEEFEARHRLVALERSR